MIQIINWTWWRMSSQSASSFNMCLLCSLLGEPKLNGSASVAPPPAPPPPVATPTDVPPTPDAPPADGSGEGRSALLGSIQGFNKQGLKKTDTVDKAAPRI